MTRRSGDRARDLTIAVLEGDSKLVAGGSWRKVLALMYGLELCTRRPEELPWKARGAHGEVAKDALKALELRQGGGTRA